MYRGLEYVQLDTEKNMTFIEFMFHLGVDINRTSLKRKGLKQNNLLA